MPAMQITTTMRPVTTPANDLPPRCNHTTPAPDTPQANLTQRIEQAARALQAARGTALRSGWSLDNCDVATRETPRKETLAQTRYEYVKSLIPKQTSRWTSPPPLIRNPWRACANGPAISREAVKAQYDHRVLPRPLWLPEADRYFPVNTRAIPRNCIARVVVPDGSQGQASLALRVGPTGWRPLGAADAGPQTCALYRPLAAAPDFPAQPAEIRVGPMRYHGAGDTWHRFAPTSSVAPPVSYSAAEVLDSIHDTQLLQTAPNKAYVPMRDAQGRFWLPVEPTQIRAIEVADPRKERCLDAVYVVEKNAGNDTLAGQYAPVLPTSPGTTRAAAAASPDAPPAVVGDERARGMGPIDTLLLVGGRNAHLQPAARLAQQWLTTALTRLMTGGHAALAPFLDEWPAHLQGRALERISDVITDIMTQAQAFNERNGSEMRLVDAIEGGAWFAARDGALYVTPAVVEQPLRRVTRTLIETIIGKMDRGHHLFPRLSDDSSILRRAGRLATYDPTIMQEALAWPERQHIANRLAQLYRTPADIAHPMSALATPRSETFGSLEGTDNLSLLLRDNDTVMAIINALQR